MSLTKKHFQVSPLLFKRSDRDVANAFAYVSFDYYPELCTGISECFCLNEINRYKHYKYEKRKRNYLIGRYACKLAASHYLHELDLSQIEIVSAIVEYPIVKHLSIDTPEITLSHCDPHAIAIAHEAGHVVGIDLEKKDPTKTRIFQREMTKAEIQLCKEFAKESTDILCNMVWTAKEAISKAIKCGLMVSFKLLEIKELQQLEVNRFRFTFKHFAHFHCYSYILDKHILSIVLPIKTQLHIDIKQLNF